jgi:hypothetical protein
MLITKKSLMSGRESTRDLDISKEDYERYERGEGLIQEIFPNLSPSDREFLMTGMTDEEWDWLFNEREGEEDPE